MSQREALVPESEIDLLVVGAGAGGMTTALVAAKLGLRVMVCEGTQQVGGTTSTSAGTLWIPGNRQGKTEGHADPIEAAQRYLDDLLGPEDERGLRSAFLATADEAIQFLERYSELRFVSAGKHPDYLPHPDAGVAGRAIAPLPFDGRKLGKNFRRIRPPLPDFMLLGGMMAGKADVLALIHRYRSWKNFIHTVKLVGRYGLDRLFHDRGTRLVMGNALVARLYYSLLQAGVEVRFEHSLCELLEENERVVGARFDTPTGVHAIHAHHGVVLATGGIGHHIELRNALMSKRTFTPRISGEGPSSEHGGVSRSNHEPSAPWEQGVQSLMASNVCGAGIEMAQRKGAILEQHPHNFFWQPVSRVPLSGGSTRLFPHLYLDRTKPGLIAVDAAGQRFTNEADSYHHFVESMLRRNEEGIAALPCHFVCNARFVYKYGLGVIPPGTRNLETYVRSGYIAIDTSLQGLASQLGISGSGLEASVVRHNADALQGKDTLFGKGDSELNRLNGDPNHQPNPCFGPISGGPYVGLAIWPADAANSAGLAVDADGRVQDINNKPIVGLYACGNDMASIMRGVYPGPGITLGPAMVFGYRIGCYVANVRKQLGECRNASSH